MLDHAKCFPTFWFTFYSSRNLGCSLYFPHKIALEICIFVHDVSLCRHCGPTRCSTKCSTRTLLSSLHLRRPFLRSSSSKQLYPRPPDESRGPSQLHAWMRRSTTPQHPQSQSQTRRRRLGPQGCFLRLCERAAGRRLCGRDRISISKCVACTGVLEYLYTYSSWCVTQINNIVANMMLVVFAWISHFQDVKIVCIYQGH